jgi:HAD superfamily hydrolase (TIGR01509 family)
MIKAVIFDMDGVIVDSEPLHFEVCMEVTRKLGKEVDKDYFNKYVGVSNPVMWEEIIKDLKIENTVDKTLELQMDLTIKHFNESSLGAISGIVKLMEDLKNNGIVCAIASSSPMIFIEAVVKKLRLEKYLEFYFSGETLGKSKPEPDIFIETAKKLGVNPKEVVVIEDSKHGVQAAKSAKMICIGYVNPNSGNQDLSKADYICNDINELSYSKIKYI